MAESTAPTALPPMVLGRDKHVRLEVSLPLVAYHYVVASMGSGRLGTDDTVPPTASEMALRLYMLRRPTTAIRNQWLTWEEDLVSHDWHEALHRDVVEFGEQVVAAVAEAVDWFAEHQWPQWRPVLEDSMALLDGAEVRTAVEKILPVLERTQLGELADTTTIQLLPRRSYREPLAFDSPRAIDLRLSETNAPGLLSLLVEQLFVELCARSYFGGGRNLLHVLDDALKRYSAHDASLDVWYSVVQFAATDLTRWALDTGTATSPGDRDVASTRRLFLEPRARRAWRDYADGTIDADAFADAIATTAVRTAI